MTSWPLFKRIVKPQKDCVSVTRASSISLLIKQVCLQKCSSFILRENDFQLSDSRSLRSAKPMMVWGFLLTFCDMPSLGGPKMMLFFPHRFSLLPPPLSPRVDLGLQYPSVLCSWSLPMSNDYTVGLCSLPGWSWDSAGGVLQHWKPCLRIHLKKKPTHRLKGR